MPARTIYRFTVLLAACVLLALAARADEPDLISESTFLARVPYTTLRNETGGNPWSAGFGNERGRLSAGYCTVSLDKNDLDRRSDLRRVAKAPLSIVLAGLNKEDANGIVVYMHGYGEDFDKSCRRAALLQTRLGIEGRMLLFSWPANANLLTYSEDVADLEWSLQHLYGLLREVANVHGSTRINLIAHSLGARGMVQTLRDIEGDDVESPDRIFGQLVLVAPDIDLEGFADDIAILKARTRAVTVFVSENDRVLRISRTVNWARRLGQGGELPFADPGISIVDISPIERADFGGHVYHLYNPAVTEELRRMLGTDAGDVAEFERVPTDTAGLWALVPVTD